jgi:hypothetical protein
MIRMSKSLAVGAGLAAGLAVPTTHTASFDRTGVRGKQLTPADKLLAGGGFKDIAAEETSTVGFASHAGYAARRCHYVSLAGLSGIGRAARVPSSPGIWCGWVLKQR